MRALALVMAWCTLAAADTPQQQADALFAEGRRLLTVAHDAAGACKKFEAANAIDPTAPGVLLNLGLCYETLERYATSLYWFRKAQNQAAESGMPAYEDEAKKHTVALATKVSTLRIDAPPGAEVIVGGRPIDPRDYGRVEVDRGTVVIEARAPGKAPFRRELAVTARDAGPVAIALTDAAPPPADNRGMRRKIVAGGLGVAGLGLCIASPLWARSIQQSYDRDMTGKTRSDELAKQHVATGMFIGGAALIGVGVYLYLTAPVERRVTAYVAPTGLGIAGTF